jgi:hypothetical protein
VEQGLRTSLPTRFLLFVLPVILEFVKIPRVRDLGRSFYVGNEEISTDILYNLIKKLYIASL